MLVSQKPFFRREVKKLDDNFYGLFIIFFINENNNGFFPFSWEFTSPYTLAKNKL